MTLGHEEKGSMTLLGTWLTGFLLFISAMLFVYSNQEIWVSNLEREGYYRQLLAESLLEKQLLALNKDFAPMEKILEQKNHWDILLDEGSTGKYIYEVRGHHIDDKITMGAVVRNKEDPTDENVFSLMWRLDVDKEAETVALKGIG